MVRLVVATVILGLFVAACGGEGEETPTGTGTPAPSVSPTANSQRFDLRLPQLPSTTFPKAGGRGSHRPPTASAASTRATSPPWNGKTVRQCG
jgi:hypothetical protein